MVHVLATGQHVSLKGGHVRIIETATGNEVRDLGPYATRREDEGEIEPPSAPAGGTEGPIPGLPDVGWIAHAAWEFAGNPFTDTVLYFTTSWIVPPAPASDDGQTVYLFSGLINLTMILQPVLQWGPSFDGGGNYWSIVNVYADGPGGPAVASPAPPIQVSPGTVLQGVITCTGAQLDPNGVTSSYDYTCQFVGYPSLDLTVTDVPDALLEAVVTLECYGAGSTSTVSDPLTQCSDYPDTTLTAMYGIDIKTGPPGTAGTDATIDWVNDVPGSPVTSFTDCGQSCQIVSNDSPGGAVYLYYRSPTQALDFINDKSSFGQDEISDIIKNGGVVPAAFYLALDGFTVQQLTVDQPSLIEPQPGGPFNSLPGVTIAPSKTYQPFYDPNNLYSPQRILYPFDIVFLSQPPASFFPSSGATDYLLTASITVGSTALGTLQQLTAKTVIDLVAGADPYFSNIDPQQDNVFYRSQDLRVFNFAPTVGSTPIDGVPFTFSPGGSPTSFDSTAAYSYIRALISHFNTTYSDPTKTDPFDLNNPKLPGQDTVYSGDSTVTPEFLGVNVYNFALARVRLQGSPGSTASPVRVFFRLFTTQTFDTDFVNTPAVATSISAPNVTYPSQPTSAPDNPASPLPGTDTAGNINGCSLPYFAAADQSDLGSGPTAVNNQSIVIPVGSDTVWAYFGCFLNVYDPTPIGSKDAQGWLVGSSHSCLVAQIAFSGTPIVNSDGVIESPENCTQLAQRNLQITLSGQPGFPATHLIPQTFDTRPSPPATGAPLGQYPDELMIDWRNTPHGSGAEIYWPAVNAADVVALADKLYPSHSLTAVDAHTIGCAVHPGMTYIPLPTAASGSFAGLITLQLPSGIHFGDEFAVVVRRVTSGRAERLADTAAAGAEPSATAPPVNWRYIVGTFQMSIPVADDPTILPGEENLLAILKWRLRQVGPTDRWQPVLLRYIDVVERRVRGLGGDPSSIPPSPLGYPGPGLRALKHRRKHIGKVCGLRYNRFGDFDGFDLRTLDGAEHRFHARERRMEDLARHAWIERHLIAVVVTEHAPHWPAEIILLRD
jgi:hypothetical protein